MSAGVPSSFFLSCGLLAVLAIGCRPDRTLAAQAGEDSWTTLPGHAVQLRVSRFEGDGTVVAVAPPSLEAATPGAPSGPAVAGTKLPLTIEGVPCTVAVLGRYEALVSKTERPNPGEVRRATETPGTRTLRGLDVRVSCGEAAVPGTDAALRGTRAVEGLAWGLPALVLGVLAGVFMRGTAGGAIAAALGCAATALACAVGLAAWQFDRSFMVTYAVLFVGLAAGGALAGSIDTPHRWLGTAAGAAGLALGAAGVAAIHGAWTAGGPIVALLGAAGCAGLGLVAVALSVD